MLSITVLNSDLMGILTCWHFIQLSLGHEMVTIVAVDCRLCSCRLFPWVQETMLSQDQEIIRNNHRISGCLRLEETSEGHLVQPHCSGQVAQHHVHLAFEDLWDSVDSLDNLFQCSITHTVMMCFLVFRWHLLCSSLCPWPLILLLGTTEESGPILFCTLPSGVYVKLSSSPG